MNDRARIRNIICAILSILLAGGLGYLFYSDQQQEKEQAAAVEALQEEAKEYENELQDLRSELSSLQSNVSYSSENAEILVGFLISEVSDIAYIEEKAETYDFSPVFVIDCTEELTDIKDIAEAIDEDWEIMLYATSYSQSVNEKVRDVLSFLKEIDREHSGVFFLRNDYNSAANIQLLIDDGFIGYTSYHEESPTVGQTDDGIVYFDYSYLTSSGTGVTDRLSYLYSGKSSMIVVFDMSSINSGSLSESYVISLLNTMQNYADKDDCSFSTVADVVEELSQINEIEAANQEEYEKQATELQEQIGELEERIVEIYEKLEY